MEVNENRDLVADDVHFFFQTFFDLEVHLFFHIIFEALDLAEVQVFFLKSCDFILLNRLIALELFYNLEYVLEILLLHVDLLIMAVDLAL